MIYTIYLTSYDASDDDCKRVDYCGTISYSSCPNKYDFSRWTNLVPCCLDVERYREEAEQEARKLWGNHASIVWI